MSTIQNHTPASPAGGRLEVELVPATCWQSNVRSYMSGYQWKKLSQVVRGRAGDRCEICAGRGRQHATECHETWHYDDHNKAQILTGLVALCPLCHAAKHLGRSIAVGNGDGIKRWIARVNGWSQHDTERYVRQVFETWRARSQFEWALDLQALETGYGVSAQSLTLERLQISPQERRALVHGRELGVEDRYDIDGRQVF